MPAYEKEKNKQNSRQKNITTDNIQFLLRLKV